ncbi:diacylglycerol/lipid kinase family protein [Natronospora cellulosivora (SeqCode)]
MSKKIMAVVNPVSSGGKTAKNWPQYIKYFQEEGLSIDSSYTSYPGHGVKLAREAVEKGYHYIMAVGGDGTINEVVNGLFKDNKLINEKIKLLIFAQGTGSDFIRTLGLKKGPEEIVKVMGRENIKSIDIGQVTYKSYDGNKESRYFINMADTGIGAATAKLVNESSKIFGGFLTYLWGIIRTLIVYRNRKVKVKVDGKLKYQEKLNSLIIANGKYFGGGIMIAPEAELDNGSLNILALKNLSKIDIIFNLIRAYKGTHLSHPLLESIKGLELSIDSDYPLDLEIDGESVGTVPASFQLLESSLSVLV